MTRSGIVWLAEQVQAYLDSVRTGTVVQCGFRKPWRQDNQGAGRANRVLFSPAAPGGKAGKLIQPRGPGEHTITSAGPPVVYRPRALRDWERITTVHVWAVNAEKPTDEGAQIEAVEDLFELTVQAVQSAIKATGIWGEVEYVEPLERSFGLELRAYLGFRAPLFDAPTERVKPGFTLNKHFEDEDTP